MSESEPEHEPELYEAMSGAAGSKYTRETGPGYLTRVALNKFSLKVPFGTEEGYQWVESDDIWAVVDDPGFAVVDDPVDEDVLAACEVVCDGISPKVLVPSGVVREQLNVGAGADVRVYQRHPGQTSGMRIVPADPDPILREGHDD